MFKGNAGIAITIALGVAKPSALDVARRLSESPSYNCGVSITVGSAATADQIVRHLRHLRDLGHHVEELSDLSQFPVLALPPPGSREGCGFHMLRKDAPLTLPLPVEVLQQELQRAGVGFVHPVRFRVSRVAVGLRVQGILPGLELNSKPCANGSWICAPGGVSGV